MHIYNCLKVMLEIKLDDSRDYDDYVDGLIKLYGKEYVSICQRVLDGTEVFHGLHSPGLSLEGFELHGELLKGYAKLHRFKEENWTCV